MVFVYSVCVFIGAQTLFYTAARKINTVHWGLVLLLEPVTAIGLDIVFLGTSLTWNMGVGGLLILTANVYLVTQSRQRTIKE